MAQVFADEGVRQVGWCLNTIDRLAEPILVSQRVSLLCTEYNFRFSCSKLSLVFHMLHNTNGYRCASHTQVSQILLPPFFFLFFIQNAPEGTNKYSTANVNWPVLDSFTSGQELTFHIKMNANHWVSGCSPCAHTEA